MTFGQSRGRGGNSGKGRGCGNIEGKNLNSKASQFNVNPTLTPSLDEPLEEPLTRTPEPSYQTSIETQISRNLEGSSHPSSENLNRGGASCGITKKRGTGRYKSMQVDMKTKYFQGFLSSESSRGIPTGSRMMGRGFECPVFWGCNRRSCGTRDLKVMSLASYQTALPRAEDKN